MSWMMYIVVVLLIASFWYLGLGMGYERGEKKQKAVAEEYRTKYHWAVDRYDDLLNRYMQLKETLAKVVDGNE